MLPGEGTITLSDVDADVLTDALEGTWSNVGGSANFTGLISGFLPIKTSGDGTFDGTDGSSISMSFPATPPYDGNATALAFGNWFTDEAGAAADFNDAATFASRAVVPEPGTFSLLTALRNGGDRAKAPAG